MRFLIKNPFASHLLFCFIETAAIVFALFDFTLVDFFLSCFEGRKILMETEPLVPFAHVHTVNRPRSNLCATFNSLQCIAK